MPNKWFEVDAFLICLKLLYNRKNIGFSLFVFVFYAIFPYFISYLSFVKSLAGKLCVCVCVFCNFGEWIYFILTHFFLLKIYIYDLLKTEANENA